MSEHLVPGVESKDVATFTDLQDRTFSLRFPYSAFMALRDNPTIEVDFGPANLISELARVLHDDNQETLYKVLCSLLIDQIEAAGETFETWQDSLFGEPEDPDQDGPLVAAAEALAAVVTGFIRNRRQRENVRKQLAAQKRSLDVIFERGVEELDTDSIEMMAEKIADAMTGGKSLTERVDQACQDLIAASTGSSGDTPESSGSPLGTTHSDNSK